MKFYQKSKYFVESTEGVYSPSRGLGWRLVQTEDDK